MDESTPLSSKLCARCGVAVAAGYVKCPRCHTELPVARARPTTGGAQRRVTDGGGTAVDRRWPSRMVIAAVAGGALAVVLIAWLLLRGGGASTASPNPTPAPDDLGAGDDTAGDDTEDTAPPVPDVPGPGAAPSSSAARGSAIAGVIRALRSERLWATVSPEAEGVLIESSFCDDAGLHTIVDSAAAELKQAGFRAVRCRAPHGAIVFDRGL